MTRSSWCCAIGAVGFLAACSSDPTAPNGAADNLGIDANGGHPAGTVGATVPLDSRPFGAGVSRNGNGTYYITRLDAGAVSGGVFPAAAFPNTITVGSIPTNVIFNSTGTTAYVTNQWSQNIGIIDVATNTQVTTIPIAGDPFNLILSLDGTRLYVSNNANNVTVADIASRNVITTIPMPGPPNGLALSRNGTRLYISHPFNGVVVEVNTATNTVVRTLVVPGSPQDMVVFDGAELFVANEAGSLDVVNLSTGAVATSIPLPGGGFGLAMSPDRAQLYVGQPAGYLTIVNRANRTIVKTLDLEGSPRKIAFNAAGKFAVVANEAGWVDFIK
ncbi:MAG: YncE family protein [Gemmatimonadota bacterium]